METQIRYCTSAEGHPLAYATTGVGPPLLITPWSWESMSSISELGREFHEALSLKHTVVRYDRRGTALSYGKRSVFTQQSEAEDIRAVVESLGVEHIALLAGFHLGPAALLYAARHPNVVTQLILYGTYAKGSELCSEEVKTSLTTMIRSHWAMASRTLADMTSPGVGGDVLELIARDCKESIDGETVARFVEMGYETDVSATLPAVVMPTLVVHRRRDRAVPFRMGLNLAAGLPNAQFVELEGRIHYPWLGDYQSVLGPILKFLGDEAPALEATAPSSGTAIILFADIVDSTALTERLGDAAFREKARELDGALRKIIREHGGSAIEGKLVGDGVMAVFTSARQAIEAALACGGAGADGGLPLHLGIHAGDVIREEGNVFGGAVNIAARISGLSAPGEVLVSDTLRGLARTSAGVAFENRGEQALKGIEEPVRVWAVVASGVG